MRGKSAPTHDQGQVWIISSVWVAQKRLYVYYQPSTMPTEKNNNE